MTSFLRQFHYFNIEDVFISLNIIYTGYINRERERKREREKKREGERGRRRERQREREKTEIDRQIDR